MEVIEKKDNFKGERFKLFVGLYSVKPAIIYRRS